MARAVELAPGRALDVACGTGHTALALAGAGIDATAVDLTDAMLAQGQRMAEERGLTNLRFVRGDAEALDEPDDHWPLVVSRYAAHHFPHPERAVQEWSRVCRPDGTILLVDVLGFADPTADTFLQTIELLRDHSHVRDFSEREWLAFFDRAGCDARLVGTWPLAQPFDIWVERMATPEPEVAVLRRLFDRAPTEARDALALVTEAPMHFTLQVGLFEATPRS